MIQITQEQISEIANSYICAEINSRFDWSTDVGGCSYNADGISSAFQEVLETLGIEVPEITEELVREHLENVSEDPDDYDLSDYTD